MTKRLYVGNLPGQVTEEEVKDWFSDFGSVETVTLATDNLTGEPKGFGFVEMDEEVVPRVIDALNLSEIDGRYLNVHLATPPSFVRRSP